jgi:hypothetical protein
MENLVNNISYDKEIKDTQILAGKIEKDGWISGDTIIVCCSPDYSSLTCQILNHSLSHLNRNELYDQLFLEMPYPTMSQVWDRDKGEYVFYDRYLARWVVENINNGYQYLFVDSATLRGKNFSKVKSLLKIPPTHYRFASLYVRESSLLIPDYYVENINYPLFEWENALNPNWDY